ncbi:MAG: SCO family protein [Opitutaceae bacterium]
MHRSSKVEEHQSGGSASWSTRRTVVAAVCGVLALASAGCGDRGPGTAAATPATTEAPAAAAFPSWPLTGEIVDVIAERKALLVRHDEIKGFMPPMTMEFRVNSGDLALAKPGQHIRATLVQEGDDYYLRQIWVDDAATAAVLAAGAAEIDADTTERKKQFDPFRAVGELLPNLALLDQEGRIVEFKRFRGKRVVINFIYSRCPIATMCPATTTKNQQLQQAARTAGIGDLEIVSVSLDPTYDTPGVLKEYASIRKIDTSNYSFVTGPERAIKQFLFQLGVIAKPDVAGINHTLSTFLIGPDGKILFREDGPDWLPEHFLQQLRTS